MKVKEFFETMNCHIVLESPKLRYIRKDGCPVEIRLNGKNIEKYADKEIITWSIYPTKIDLIVSTKGTVIYGYISLMIKNED